MLVGHCCSPTCPPTLTPPKTEMLTTVLLAGKRQNTLDGLQVPDRILHRGIDTTLRPFWPNLGFESMRTLGFQAVGLEPKRAQAFNPNVRPRLRISMTPYTRRCSNALDVCLRR